MELARTEVTAEVKKGVQGSVFFIVALSIFLFSLFFFFFTLARAAVALAAPVGRVRDRVRHHDAGHRGLVGLLGYLRVRKIRKPERTIASLKESAQVLQQPRSSRGRRRRELERAPRYSPAEAWAPSGRDA